MKILYNLDFSQKDQKYVHLELNIELEKYDKKELILLMPVWSPGSYLIREYSRHLDQFVVYNKLGDQIKYEKISKNKWKIDLAEQKNITIRYRLYCNELTVRNNFVDDIHALLVAPATFLIPENKDACKYFEVQVNLPDGWNKISTGLNKVEGKENHFYCEDLDDFLDCPIEVGNYQTYSFEALGKPHYVAMIGAKVYQEEKLIGDIKKVVEATAKIFDSQAPYDHYTFITHLTSASTGGIEHKNSCVLHFNRWHFSDPVKYKKDWLSLVSHEYFHLWNVKRIKPLGISNFDYSNENYTSLLWFSEGFTSYFDDLILKRAGIYNDTEYLDVLSNLIERLLTVPGRFYQNLEESSFDSWIKFYRKHENSTNQGISYYIKGSHFALVLDLEIRKRTNHQKSLDDLMRLLWNDYLLDNSIGFTREILLNYAEKLAGNFSEIFNEFIEGKNEIDYDKYLAYAGLKLKIIDFNNLTLDIDFKEENGLLICTNIKDQGAGYNAGIMSGDELIA
ncbi:MAG: M61 family metallopeptidase, partial [Candidatus Sericytochromatia bacterium]|nr:M61 family metallopeptidase [Candidatus Sericytochromatia bacterium]